MDSNSWEVVDGENYGEEVLIENNQNHHRYGQNVKNYETEWRDLCFIIQSDSELKKLREKAVCGDLKISKFRSVIWNILLGSLSSNPDEWINQKQEQRAKYSELREKHILSSSQLQEAEKLDDPLSQSKDSKWNQHFRDAELRQLIKQDVVRTNPNVDYYHTPEVQEIMINVLFCYAREFPSICYRQGMHEILAPLIFVLHCDLQSMGHIQEETSISLDPLLVAILNPNYIEEDSYNLFCQIMNSLELFYRINDMTITESGQLTNSIPKFGTSTQSSPIKTIPIIPTTGASPKRTSEIEVVHQLNLIRDKIFAKQDLHLHNHLLKLEIPLALFGIRWLRLLFGREFNLLDLLILWDAIFGVGDNLKFTYYIVVAMLIHIRDRLLSNDYTTCLTLLMRYPADVDISLIIRHALYMCEPDKYQCPPNAFVYVISSLKQRQIQPTRVYPPLATLGSRSSISSPRKLRDEIRKETAKITRKPHTEDGVVEGMTLNDPEVLKMELQDSYNVMSVSRIKLLQYVSTLRKYIPGNQIDELHQTLDGIEELCSLLKPKNQHLFDITDPGPIDPAFEADDCEEATASPSHASRSFPMSFEAKTKLSSSYEVPINRVSRTTSQILQKHRAEVEMNLIRTSTIGCVDLSKYPVENPVGGDEYNSD